MSCAHGHRWRPAPAMTSTRGTATARPSSTADRRTGPTRGPAHSRRARVAADSRPRGALLQRGHPAGTGRGHRPGNASPRHLPRAGRRHRAGVPLAVEPEPGHCSPPSRLPPPPPSIGDPAALGLTLDIGHVQWLETPLTRRLRTRRRPLAAPCPDRGHAARRPEHLRSGRGDRLPAVLEALAGHRYRASRRRTCPPLPRGPHFAEQSLPFSTARPGRSPTAAKGESRDTPHPSRHAPASETRLPPVAELHAR